MKTNSLLLAFFAANTLFWQVALIGAEVDVSKLPPVASGEAIFERDIKPLLERSCVPCHGPARQKAHFRVDSREALLEGGESHQAAIVAGNSAASPLVLNMAGLVKEMEMPPLEKRDRYPAMAPAEIALFRAWLDQGARWPEGVALQLKEPVAEISQATPTAAADPGAAPIFEQIRRGQRQAIARSLQEPACLDLRDPEGNTPLIQAAFYLDAKDLARFLKAGADPNATNSAGLTPLMKAVSDLDKTRLLLEHHANVNAVSRDKDTPLIIACYCYGAAPIIKELLRHGADVCAPNQLGANALMAAAESGDAGVLRLLLDHNADPNSTARSPESNLPVSALMLAAQLGHLDCVKLLLARGAKVNLNTGHGNALACAVFTDRRDVVRLLLDHGAEVNAPGRRLASFRNDTGLTPLMYAALNERNDPTIVRWLLARGADVGASSAQGETALSIARLRGDTRIVAALVAAGAHDTEADNLQPRPVPRWTPEQVAAAQPNILRQAAEAGVALLLQSSTRLAEATGNRCFTCHQNAQPTLAWNLARENGLAYPKDLATRELNDAIRVSRRRTDIAIQQPLPVPSIAAWFLVGLNAASYPPDSLTDAWAYSLARYQAADGRWPTRAARAPMDYSDVSGTALAIKALKAYAPPTMKQRFAQRIARGAGWLRTYQPQSTEERAFQLLGLFWAGENGPEMKSRAKGLLAEQREDGGWAQIPTLQSDPYATGLSLYTLYRLGCLNPSHPASQRGIRFLLQNQCNDGSWFVRTRSSPVQIAINDIFAHGKDQWISSAGTSWASMALMLASAPGGQQIQTSLARKDF